MGVQNIFPLFSFIENRVFFIKCILTKVSPHPTTSRSSIASLYVSKNKHLKNIDRIKLKQITLGQTKQPKVKHKKNMPICKDTCVYTHNNFIKPQTQSHKTLSKVC